MRWTLFRWLTPKASGRDRKRPRAGKKPRPPRLRPDFERLETRWLMSNGITEFTLPTANSYPYGITAGADGNLWFTEYLGNKIGKLTPSGTLTEYTIPTSNSQPRGITLGPDGNVWFVESAHAANKVANVNPCGAFTEYTIPTANSEPLYIVTGPDGNL